MARKREHPSALRILDDLVGTPLTWLTGAPKRTSGSKADHAIGEMLSWTGLAGSRKRHRRRADG